MSTRNEHWDAIFSGQADSELGWYENDTSQTFKFLKLIPQRKNIRIFLPGAGTSQLVDELLAREYTLILNDISEEALNTLKSRIGENNRLQWLHHDMSKPLPGDTPQVDLWVDRAVLHFLLEDADIQCYFENVRSVVRARGYVLLAEFSITGAAKCAGLDLHRYSVEEMTKRLGKEFTLIKQEDYTFINPSGDSRPYIYALYQRSGR